MAQVIDAILRLTDNFTPTLTSIHATARRQVRDIENLGRQLSYFGSDLQSFGTGMSAMVTLPLAGLATSAINTAMDFEASMSRVQALSGATAEEIDALNNKAIEISSSTSLGSSDVSEAFQFTALAGWDTSEMLDGIDAITNLALASGEDLGVVSDILTDSITGFGYAATDANLFSDILAKTAASSNTSIYQMGEAFKYAAPIAGALGYEVDQVALITGIMADTGIKASEAGTSLRTMFTRLQGDISIARNGMDDYVFSTSNADGTMKPLQETIGHLREAFSTLTESEKSLAAQTLVGTEAMTGLLAIVNASDEHFNSLADNIANAEGSAQHMADIMADNAKGSVTELMSSIESLAITIGNMLMPHLITLVGHVSTVVDWFGSLSVSQQESILQWSLIVAAIGPFLSIIGTVITFVGSLVKVFSALKVVVSVVAGVFTAINIVWVAIIGVVIGLIAYVYHLSKQVNSLGDAFLLLGTKLANFFIDTLNFVLSVVSDISNGVISALNGIISLINKVAGTSIETIATVHWEVDRLDESRYLKPEQVTEQESYTHLLQSSPNQSMYDPINDYVSGVGNSSQQLSNIINDNTVEYYDFTETHPLQETIINQSIKNQQPSIMSGINMPDVLDVSDNVIMENEFDVSDNVVMDSIIDINDSIIQPTPISLSDFVIMPDPFVFENTYSHSQIPDLSDSVRMSAGDTNTENNNTTVNLTQSVNVSGTVVREEADINVITSQLYNKFAQMSENYV